MIKPVTFQGISNFNANLYALEVKSRFIDQQHADGYYEGYADELSAQIVGQTIRVGTGAYLVQGRMSEITAPETVRPQIFDGFKGYVVARIETYHPADELNPTIVAKVNTDFAALDRELEQSDTYAANADKNNIAYELPIYSFEISGTQIVNLQKLIKPIRDYAAELANKAIRGVEDLAKQIGEKQGTTVTVKGAAQPTFEAGGLIDEADEIYITCGGA